jgi:hypothetical protein
MLDALQDAGCPRCRYFFVAAPRPPQLAVSRALHASLYQCPACHTYWEEFDRYALPVTPEQALADFPEIADAAQG